MKKLLILFLLFSFVYTKAISSEDYVYPFGYYGYNSYGLEATPTLSEFYEEPTYANPTYYDFVNY